MVSIVLMDDVADDWQSDELRKRPQRRQCLERAEI